MELYQVILALLFGVLPSLAWLFYYLAKDLHPEPKKMILRVFLFGALVTVPVFFVQLGLSEVLEQWKLMGFFDGYPVIGDIIRWFIVIALTEEALKYAVVKLTVERSRELDEPLDFMLYMVVVALGFAALENVLYLIFPVSGGNVGNVILATVFLSFMRFAGATFLHTLCSALVGYFMALNVIRRKRKSTNVLVGIALAALLHGLYDFSIMVLPRPFSFLIPVGVVLGLAIFIFYDFDEIKKVKSICTI